MSTDLVGLITDLERNMSQVVLGKLDVIRMCLVALLAGEHVLLEDVPGVGNLLFRRLVERFGSPEAVFEADNTALLAVKGVTSRLVTATICSPRHESAVPEVAGPLVVPMKWCGRCSRLHQSGPCPPPPPNAGAAA